MKEQVRKVLILASCMMLGSAAAHIGFAQENAHEIVPPQRTLDDKFARIAQDVPGFCGSFLDEQGDLVLCLVKPTFEAQTAAKAAVERLFHRRSGNNVRVQEGQYDFLQLLEWKERLDNVLSLPGVVFLDLDEVRNRVVIAVNRHDPSASRRVEQFVQGSGVPREAVIIEESEPVVLE